MPRPSPPDWGSPTAWFVNISYGHYCVVVNRWTLSAMSNPSTSVVTDIERDPAYLAAAEWFLRLQDTEVTLDDTLAWQAWLTESPRNAEAFARLEEMSQVLQSIPTLLRISARELERDCYDGSFPGGGGGRPRPGRRRPGGGARGGA